DVPMIQMPTMHEVEGNVTRRQDSDEPGRQFRLYEVAGIGHVDSRDNVRLLPNPCTRPLSTFPLQVYMSVGLHHLFRWVDEGIVPPRADRILVDRDTHGDGTMMATDEHGNPLGGIRNPYVDVPVARYAPVNTAREPLIDNPSEYVAKNGLQGARLMCRLSAYQEPFSQEKLRALYGSKERYLQAFQARLDEPEREGWSPPANRAQILADADAVAFWGLGQPPADRPPPAAFRRRHGSPGANRVARLRLERAGKHFLCCTAPRARAHSCRVRLRRARNDTKKRNRPPGPSVDRRPRRRAERRHRAAAADRPRALLRRSRARGRDDLPGRRPHRVPQAVRGGAQRVGQAHRRAVRRRAAGNGRPDAADPAVLLEPRRPLHPLRAGPGRRRELQPVRGGRGRGAGRPRRAAGP